jgi:putative transposase
MPGPKPLHVTLNDTQRDFLEHLVRRQTSPQRLVRRAKTILYAAEGMNNAQIADQLATSRNTVSLWRQRWLANAEALNAAQAAGDGDPTLRKRMVSMLGDGPRPGAPSDFSAEQLTRIISVACESPEDSGRPVTHWTPRELRDEVVKRGIVETISLRTVGRFFKRSRSQTAPLAILAQPSARSKSCGV